MSASDDGVREGPAQPTRERVCPYTDVGPSLSPLRVAHLGSEPARGREKVTDDRGDVGIGDGPYEAADLDEQGPFPMETVYLWEDGPNGTTRMTL